MKLKKIAAAVLAATVLAATPAAGALLSPLSVTANAADTLTEGDYSYTVNEDGETVTITDYSGNEPEVIIPSILGGKTVTVIGNNAFAFGDFTSIMIPDCVTGIEGAAFSCCRSLTSITIPNSVKTIGSGVFFDCWKLEEINVDDNNTSFSSINGVLFNNNKSTLICCPAGKKDESYEIPDGVTEVDVYGFVYCRSLMYITIPESVTKINNSFSSCESLKSITVKENNANYSSLDGVLFNKDKSTIISYPPGKKMNRMIYPMVWQR